MYTRDRKEFPGHSTFTKHFGNKAGLLAALAKWVRENDESDELVALIPESKENLPKFKQDDASVSAKEGHVYLSSPAVTTRSDAATNLSGA